MNRPFRIFITRLIPEVGPDLLKNKCDIKIYPERRSIPAEILLEEVKDIDGLICLLSDEISAEIMDTAPDLKVISNFAVGYNNIDLESATKRGIVVTNTPGVLTDATADTTWALLMAISRRIVEGDSMVRRGKFDGWGPMLLLGHDIMGKTLGIVGAGRIGGAVALRSVGWEMKILYTDNNRNSMLEEKLGAEKVSLHNLLKQSDFITIHLPLTERTHHLFDESALKKMKKTACLINTARGAIINENALLLALRDGWIAGAALDVYEKEPDVTAGLTELSNVVLAPHIGSATYNTRNEMSRIAAKNLLAVLEGKHPPFPVNNEVFS